MLVPRGIYCGSAPRKQLQRARTVMKLAMASSVAVAEAQSFGIRVGGALVYLSRRAATSEYKYVDERHLRIRRYKHPNRYVGHTRHAGHFFMQGTKSL